MCSPVCLSVCAYDYQCVHMIISVCMCMWVGGAGELHALLTRTPGLTHTDPILHTFRALLTHRPGLMHTHPTLHTLITHLSFRVTV